MRAIQVRYADSARAVLDALPGARRAALRVRLGELAEVVAADVRDRMGLVDVVVRADDAEPVCFAHASIDRQRHQLEVGAITLAATQVAAAS